MPLGRFQCFLYLNLCEKLLPFRADFSWKCFFYNYHIIKKVLVLQCINFNVNFDYKFTGFSKVVLDCRLNFGGEVKEMLKYFDWIKKLLKENNIEHCFVLVSNATCSSAEILVEKLSLLDNVIIVGSETYKKKFAYKIIDLVDKKVYIPFYELTFDIKIKHEINFDIYYDVFSVNNKKYYNKPELWNLVLNKGVKKCMNY